MTSGRGPDVAADLKSSHPGRRASALGARVDEAPELGSQAVRPISGPAARALQAPSVHRTLPPGQCSSSRAWGLILEAPALHPMSLIQGHKRTNGEPAGAGRRPAGRPGWAPARGAQRGPSRSRGVPGIPVPDLPKGVRGERKRRSQAGGAAGARTPLSPPTHSPGSASVKVSKARGFLGGGRARPWSNPGADGGRPLSSLRTALCPGWPPGPSGSPP